MAKKLRINDRVGLRLCAEWEAQVGVALAWPHGVAQWENLENIASLEKSYVDFVTTIAWFESVYLLVPPEGKAAVTAIFKNHGARLDNITFCEVKTNDCWLHDYGPMGLWRNGQSEWLDFRFNGWGGKFAAEEDDRATAALFGSCFAGQVHGALNNAALFVEGGSLEVDGRGTLLATRSSILNDNRRHGLSDEEIESQLIEALGLKKIHWIKNSALTGDDTDGHIDLLARFVAPDSTSREKSKSHRVNKIIHATAPAGHSDHEVLCALTDELQGLRDIDDNAYELVGIDLPAPRHDRHGEMLCASYLNYLLINGALLMPTFDDAQDGVAMEILGKAFPAHAVVGVDSRAFIHQGGALHCLSMHLPAGAQGLG